MGNTNKKEMEYGRNLVECDENPVRHGELYIDPGFFENWDKELELLNKGKVGRKFQFPTQFIRFLMLMHIRFHLSYRHLEGFLEELSQLVPEVRVTDYTNIYKRGTKLQILISSAMEEGEEPIIIAINSSGAKIANRREWMGEAWEDMDWIRVHLSVNMETNEIVSLERVTDETVEDDVAFNDIIEDAEENVGEGEIKKRDEAILVVFTLADGLYGVDVSQVREITSMQETAPVPNSPYYVDGVINLMGQVTTVTDLRRRFGLDERERDDNTRIIIVEPEGVPIGMVVDSVSEVLRMPADDIEPVPDLVVADADYVKGVGKLGDGRLLILLDLEKVLAAS